MDLKNFIERYPVLAYFVLVYAIAWGGILLVVQAFASPGEADSGNLVAMIGLPVLSSLSWRARCAEWLSDRNKGK
jgi:hypothetical protein